MEITLYQLRKDGHSEYMMFCPYCDDLFVIHETCRGKEIFKSKKCSNCKYELPIQHIYFFICKSIKQMTKYIPDTMKQLWMLYNDRDENYELNVYTNTLPSCVSQ